MAGMYPKHPEHLEKFEYVGPYSYFLTFCTAFRHHAFVDAERVDLVMRQIQRASTQEGFAITAYCFMPDHLHLLVEGTREQSDLRRFIKLAKQQSGFHYKRTFRNGLWQRYGFEHILRSDERALDVARYILDNPFRGGLCESIYEYPFMGSDAYSLEAIAEAVQMQPRWRQGRRRST